MIFETEIRSNKIQDWTWVKEKGELLWDTNVLEYVHHHQNTWFKHCKQRRICLQAGGALGLYPRLLSNIFNLVITCEPTPESFHCLVNNNQLANVIKLNVALGEESKLVQMHEFSEDTGQNLLILPDIMDKIIKKGNISKFKAFAKPVMMITVDSLNIQELDLLALDIEMYELFALQGAAETIKRCRPVIVVENAVHCRDWLYDIGYQEAEQSFQDTVFIPT